MTVRLAFMRVVQRGVSPAQLSLQRANADPVAGAAVSVTTMPLSTSVVHVEPQSIAATSARTVPVPVPVLRTLSDCLTASGARASAYRTVSDGRIEASGFFVLAK